MLLAFDMGVGKTITALGCAEELFGMGAINSVLVICPSGLKYQWAQAIAERTDVATREILVKGESMIVPEERYCMIVDGSPNQRRELYRKINDLEPDYIIAGYKTVTNDLRIFRNLEPSMVVLDEATTIKNPRADVTKSIRRITAPYRLALTGTPVDNHLEELWHVMAWVDETVLGPFDLFDKSHIERDYWGNVKSYRNLHVLRKKITRHVVRKRFDDPDVAPYMPDLEHSRITVSMDNLTRQVYLHVLKDLRRELSDLPMRSSFDLHAHYSGEGEDTAAGRVMAVHTAAEMLLTEPELLFESDSNYAQRLVDDGVLVGLPPSAKLRKLEVEVDSLLEIPGSKIIIVTRWRGMVDRLAERWPQSVVYHGGMSALEKQVAVNLMNNDPNVRVFIMSHAGAFGVDIPAANHLFNLDPARATGQRSQINRRHVRAGSRHSTVYVTDLVTSGTIEERMYARLGVRGRVAGAVLDGQGADVRGRIKYDVQSLTDHIDEALDT